MLLTKYSENNCFKCGLAIDSPAELSIEHKEPWEGRSVELFWDLDNIAFSHLVCNRPHLYCIKESIDGKTQCSKCKEYKLFSEFYKEEKPYGIPIESICKLCSNEKRKKYKQLARHKANVL